jgi:hypothetical protein
MSKPTTWSPASPGERPLPETVRTFLVESERCVLLHCQRLLAQNNLSDEDRQRLHRLAAAAERELQRLAGWRAMEAA